MYVLDKDDWHYVCVSQVIGEHRVKLNNNHEFWIQSTDPNYPAVFGLNPYAIRNFTSNYHAQGLPQFGGTDHGLRMPGTTNFRRKMEFDLPIFCDLPYDSKAKVLLHRSWNPWPIDITAYTINKNRMNMSSLDMVIGRDSFAAAQAMAIDWYATPLSHFTDVHYPNSTYIYSIAGDVETMPEQLFTGRMYSARKRMRNLTKFYKLHDLYLYRGHLYLVKYETRVISDYPSNHKFATLCEFIKMPRSALVDKLRVDEKGDLWLDKIRDKNAFNYINEDADVLFKDLRLKDLPVSSIQLLFNALFLKPSDFSKFHHERESAIKSNVCFDKFGNHITADEFNALLAPKEKIQ